jgi:hypothetical protein
MVSPFAILAFKKQGKQAVNGDKGGPTERQHLRFRIWRMRIANLGWEALGEIDGGMIRWTDGAVRSSEK